MPVSHGWYWFCEDHKIFGTANSADEAKILLKNHWEFNKNKCREIAFVESLKSSSTEEKTISKEIKPNNAGEKWTLQEEQLLHKLFNDKYSLEQMTEKLKRSELAIISRLKKMNLVPVALSDAEIKSGLAKRYSDNQNKELKNQGIREKLRSNIRFDRGRNSFKEFGTVNPPPISHPELKEQAKFKCSICNAPIVGNRCNCGGD